MTLLTKAEIDERVALYQQYGDAIDRYAALDAALPLEAPSMMAVSLPGFVTAEDRVTAVVRRAWTALREATLRDMRVELDAAEAAVRAFEEGTEVNDDKRSDSGVVSSAVANGDEGHGE